MGMYSKSKKSDGMEDGLAKIMFWPPTLSS